MTSKNVEDIPVEKENVIEDFQQSNSSVKNTKYHKDHGHYVSKLFWGLLLVLIGGLLLANNFGLVSVNLSNLWSLWPLAIIGAGISVLSFHSIIWRIFVSLFIISILVLIAWVAIGSPSISSPVVSKEVTIQKLSDNIQQADISVASGANNLYIDTLDQNAIVKAKLQLKMVQRNKSP